MQSKDKAFKELESLLGDLDIEVKYGRGYFRGGLVRYHDKSYMYLNRAGDTDTHTAIIIAELKKLDLSEIELSPEIKELIEQSAEGR
jgi:hypothetical protein